MFFFIGGVAPRIITLDKHPRSCSTCGRPALLLKRLDHYLVLFFIPLFPVKRGKPYLSCNACGAHFDEPGEQRLQDRASQERLCRRCGRTIGIDFRYCPNCGNLIVP